jgi:hypothetical protein
MYEDDTVRVDTEGVDIKNYYGTGKVKHIGFDRIRSVGTFTMGYLSGRWRVIGLGPAKLRNWFAWDTGRGTKSTAVFLDLGKWIRPTFAPDDPEAVVAIIDEASSTS